MKRKKILITVGIIGTIAATFVGIFSGKITGEFEDRSEQDELIYAINEEIMAKAMTEVTPDVETLEEEPLAEEKSEDAVIEEEYVITDSATDEEMIDDREKVDPDDIELLGFYYIQECQASSSLKEADGSVHTPDYLVDGDLSTAWVEDAPGVGRGEAFAIILKTEADIVGFRIANGYFKSDDLYQKNGKINNLKVTFDDGSYEMCRLDSYESIFGKPYSDMFVFEYPHRTESIVFEIIDAEEGSIYDDTCVSEIELYTEY